MTVDPSLVALARCFGWLLILVAAISLFSGKTYSKANASWGLTDRHGAPGAHWVAVLCDAGLGLFLVAEGWFTLQEPGASGQRVGCLHAAAPPECA